jgi:CHAD domain-containing protein
VPVINFIVRYWDAQHHILINNLILVRQKPSKKVIHDLRVAVKKIRSVLRLTEHIATLPWKDSFRNTKILFNTLGRYRDIEMCLSLFSKYNLLKEPAPAAFKKYLKATLSLCRGRIKKAVADYDETELTGLTALVHSALLVFTDQELRDKIKEQAENLFKESKQLAGDFKKNSHEIRKLLKDVYYWLTACPDNRFFDPAGMKAFEEMLDNLGQSQDHSVFQKKLRYFRKEFLVKETGEYTVTKNLEQIITCRRDELLKLSSDQFQQLYEIKKSSAASR